MLQSDEWSGDRTWEADQHIIVEAPEGYLKWTVVRNPFGRAVSLWLYSQPGLPERGGFGKPVFDTFREYLRWVLLKQVTGDGQAISVNNSFFYWPITQWFKSVKPDLVLKLEELPRCLLSIPCFQGKALFLPFSNYTACDQWRQYYGPEEEALVRECFKSDFEEYGYDDQIRSIGKI
jgi:hypothetical protein